MESREYALPRLRAIRKAAVVVVETIRKFRLEEDYLDPQSQEAAIVRGAMSPVLRSLRFALSELQGDGTKETVTKRKDPDSGVEYTEIKAPRLRPRMAYFVSDGYPFLLPDELVQASAAWDLIYKAWDVMRWQGWDIEIVRKPSTVETKIVEQLEKGISLLDQFEEHQSGDDRPLLSGSRSFIVPVDIWERLKDSIEALRQVEDPALPGEVQQALVESAEGTQSSIQTEVPVSNEPDPWQHRAKDEDCSVSIIKAYGGLTDLQNLLAKDYSGLTDPQHRAESCPGLGYVAKQAIDNLVGSVADIVCHFSEAVGVPVEPKPGGGTTGKAPAVEEQAGGGKRGTKKTKTRKIDVAITLVVRNPELDDAEIARRARCDRSYLTKNKEYQRNADMARRAMVRQQNQAKYDARSGQAHPTINDPS
jgi:hypothetical protein